MSRGEPSGQSETVNLTKRQPFELGVFHKQTVAATAVKPLRDFQKSASDCKSVTTGNVRTSMQLGRRKSNRLGKTAAAESAYRQYRVVRWFLLPEGELCLRPASNAGLPIQWTGAIWPDCYIYGGNCKQVCIALGFCVYLQPELRYGVMVALQILVLSAQVRILVPQPKKSGHSTGLFLFIRTSRTCM